MVSHGKHRGRKEKVQRVTKSRECRIPEEEKKARGVWEPDLTENTTPLDLSETCPKTRESLGKDLTGKKKELKGKKNGEEKTTASMETFESGPEGRRNVETEKKK